MLRKLGGHLRNQWAGFTALFLVLCGGVAWAADGPLAGQNTVGSEDIIGNEVKSDDIGNGRIFNLDIADDIIQAGKIKDGTLGDADFGPPGNWIEIPLNAGWAVDSVTPGCYRDFEGMVHLRGTAVRTSSTNFNDPFADFPAACLPQVEQYVIGTTTDDESIGNGFYNAYADSVGVFVIDFNNPPVDGGLSLDSITWRGIGEGSVSSPAQSSR